MLSRLFGFCCVLVGVVVPSLAAAQVLSEEEYHRNITIHQPRPFLEAARVELSAGGVWAASSGIYGHAGVRGQVDYHINEDFYVGAGYTHLFAYDTGLRDEIEGEFNLVSDRSEMWYQALVRFGWVPIVGKASVFGTGIGYFDTHIFIGGGVTGTRLSVAAPTGTIGLGTRWFFTKGLAVSLELADSPYWETFLKTEGLVHNVTVMLGISVFLPYNVDDRFVK
ncbi:MAG: outer membrane beta-barrel domain-containing protein [Deltaproteobacteria bacterium]|nr:outer membrane beta-barrel domain-containing protein [Deltaproteobacteria bacterium]